MREIKFRAWVPNLRKMSRPFTIEEVAFNGGDTYARELWSWRDELKLIQYTGLKDKNGVEIYEGDIVRRTWGWKTVSQEDDSSDAQVVVEHLTCGIRWLPPNLPEDEGFKPLYSPEEDPENLGEFQWNLRNFEVVGNIYENPELVEAKQ
jgi:uncharacterized phage protein (TIGR01671 family)